MRVVAGSLIFFLMAALMVSFMAGCNNKDKEPSGIIPRAEMTTILWDIIQADQYADLYLAKDSARMMDSVRMKDSVGTKGPAGMKNLAGQKDSAGRESLAGMNGSAGIRAYTPVNVKMETLKLYQQVFTLHHITREEFNKSFLYYQERPDLTRGMFDSLVSRGNRLRTENYNRPPATPVITHHAIMPAGAGARVPPATTKLPPGIVPRPGINPRPGISPKPGVTIPGQPGGIFHRPVSPKPPARSARDSSRYQQVPAK